MNSNNQSQSKSAPAGRSAFGSGVSPPPLAGRAGTASREAVARAQSEFIAVVAAPPTASIPADASARKPVGVGACPKCGRHGNIYAEVAGGVRHLVYAACTCRRP